MYLYKNCRIVCFFYCSNQEIHEANNVFESRGLKVEECGKKYMEGYVEAAREAATDKIEPIKFASGPVPEKVVFCVDAHFGNLYRRGDGKTLRRILSSITTYIALKRQVNVKPVDFAILVMKRNSSEFIPLPNKKAIQNALTQISELDVEESGPYDLSDMFTCLAETSELPDASIYGQQLPPPHSYHFILLFGRNRFVPTLTSPNAFYFLTDNPYVCLDILYIYKCDVKKNKQEKITQALKGLIREEMDYFYACEGCQFENLQFTLFKLLGHPMIRSPQNAVLRV